MPISLLILMMLVTNSAHAFTLATWNVAEFADADALRLTRLIEAVITDLPDVIFLQEAESVTLKQLRKLSRLSAEYAVLQGTDRGGLPPGGIVILVKKSLKLRRTSYRYLPSEMDRGALSFTVDLCGYPHRLTNTHLESPDLLFWRSRNFRRQQVLALIGDQQAGRMILAGDFNLMMEGDADQLFPSTWIDAWLQLHPQEPGLTWDPAVNKVAYRQGSFVLPGYRLDRVLFRSDVLTPVNIRRVGVGIDKPLSDHFGLLAEFACNDRSL